MSADLITPEESVRLCQLERIIQKGKDTFVEVGTALAEIRDAKLYRPKQTFEEYCKDRWDFSYRRAVQMIEAAVAVKNVNHGSDSAPTSERQARPLAKLPAEQQPAAWERAQEIAKEEGKEKPAARHVEAAVLEVMPKDEPETVVVDGTQEDSKPRTRERIATWIPDDAARLWLIAKTDLDKILPNDKSRERVLRDVIEYAQARIKNKK